jgi:hypothetical protein
LSDFYTTVSLVSNDGEWREFPIKKNIYHLAVMQLATADLQPAPSTVMTFSRHNLRDLFMFDLNKWTGVANTPPWRAFQNLRRGL